MNVKWERRGSEHGGRRRRVHLHAILVHKEMERGEQKERVIAELSSVEERFLKAKEVGMRAFHRGLFWTVAEKKLTELEIDGKEREGIEAELLAKVPRPSDDWGLWAVKCIPEFER